MLSFLGREGEKGGKEKEKEKEKIEGEKTKQPVH